jgi:hypothetical protein
LTLQCHAIELLRCRAILALRCCDGINLQCRSIFDGLSFRWHSAAVLRHCGVVTL